MHCERTGQQIYHPLSLQQADKETQMVSFSPLWFSSSSSQWVNPTTPSSSIVVRCSTLARELSRANCGVLGWNLLVLQWSIKSDALLIVGMYLCERLDWKQKMNTNQTLLCSGGLCFRVQSCHVSSWRCVFPDGLKQKNTEYRAFMFWHLVFVDPV